MTFEKLDHQYKNGYCEDCGVKESDRAIHTREDGSVFTVIKHRLADSSWGQPDHWCKESSKCDAIWHVSWCPSQQPDPWWKRLWQWVFRPKLSEDNFEPIDGNFKYKKQLPDKI